jgi:RIO-like serine/threonine protein kinase
MTRVGSRLRDAMRVRHMNIQAIYDQAKFVIEQLHASGYAHCDICVDNIFVDSEKDGSAGDLEYCRQSNEKPPADIRRADSKAKTAGELDLIQLEKLKDELASI